jgi:hypothetical protein
MITTCFAGGYGGGRGGYGGDGYDGYGDGKQSGLAKVKYSAAVHLRILKRIIRFAYLFTICLFVDQVLP